MNSFLVDLSNSIGLLKPEFALIITLVLAIFVDVIFKKHQLATGFIAIAGFAATAFILGAQGLMSDGSFALSNLLAIDSFSQFFKVITLISAILTTIMTFNSKELLQGKNSVGEFYILLIGMTVGMFLLSSSSNLIMIYLAFETMSICSYVLAGYTKEVLRSSEASLKYVIYGSLASGVMIYGISLIFGLTGSFDLSTLATALVSQPGNNLALIAAILLIIAGIAYKISAVPFHFWTPDVYEGSPVATTALLSVASKAAGFAVLIRFLNVSLSDPDIAAIIDIKWVIATLAVLTMTLGNLLAVWQTNVKRMLAYSSIAHAGYMLMGAMLMTTSGMEGVMFYFITYLLMNFGAFYVVQLVANKLNSEELDAYAGLGYRSPVVAISMTLFLVSLAGVPPFVGYLGKFYLFKGVIEANEIFIAVVGVLNSVVSLFYYMKVVGYMFLRGRTDTPDKLSFSTGSIVFLLAMAIPVALLVINAQPLFQWVQNAAHILAK